MSKNEERNILIKALLARRVHSYAVIGKLMHCSRNVVAGVAFRTRYPAARRNCGVGGKKNITGHGWQPAAYKPEKTTLNTR